jgi:hypothetical protein
MAILDAAKGLLLSKNLRVAKLVAGRYIFQGSKKWMIGGAIAGMGYTGINNAVSGQNNSIISGGITGAFRGTALKAGLNLTRGGGARRTMSAYKNLSAGMGRARGRNFRTAKATMSGSTGFTMGGRPN